MYLSISSPINTRRPSGPQLGHRHQPRCRQSGVPGLHPEGAHSEARGRQRRGAGGLQDGRKSGQRVCQDTGGAVEPVRGDV